MDDLKLTSKHSAPSITARGAPGLAEDRHTKDRRAKARGDFALLSSLLHFSALPQGHQSIHPSFFLILVTQKRMKKEGKRGWAGSLLDDHINWARSPRGLSHSSIPRSPSFPPRPPFLLSICTRSDSWSGTCPELWNSTRVAPSLLYSLNPP
jgi:hypothetical protein